MATKERAVDRGARTARNDLIALGGEIRAARATAGLSQRTVGTACGMSHSTIGRIERAIARSVTVTDVTRIGAVVGLDVRIKAYPGPTALRDAAHVALLSRFRALLHPRLMLRLEVPIVMERDQRAWDGVIERLVDGPASLPVEAETKLYDLQAQLRRARLKQRDDAADHMLLLVADTRANRRAVRAAWPLIRDSFPVPGRRAVRALRESRHPGGSAIVFL